MEKLCKLRDIQRAITNIEHIFSDHYGISFNEAMLLCTIFNHSEKLTPNELSDTLGLTHSNTSKIISSVEKKGYIVRELGKEDKRHMYFALTEAGRELITSIDCSKIEVPHI